MSGGVASLQEHVAAFAAGALTRDEFWRRMREQHHLLEQYTALAGRGELAAIEIHASGLRVVLKDGLRMGFRPDDTRSVPSVIVNHGSYEPLETGALCALAESAAVVLDIGANAGFMALKMARAAHNDALRIHAFEPVLSTYEQLVENTELNGLQGRVLPHRLALGERPGSVKFFVPAFHGSVAASARPLFEGENREVEVEMSTLDAFAETARLERIDLIKCDVEGAELFVLRGGLATLERFRPVLMLEMLRKWSRAFGYHPNEILSLLAALGYQCFSLEPDGLHEHRSIEETTAPTNFFFLHPERHAGEHARLAALAPSLPGAVTTTSKQGASDRLARAVRRHVVEMVHRARASHGGSGLSAADILAVLYADVLRVDASAPTAPGRDRFIMSKGHAAAALYATLAERGFFPRDWLPHFCEDGSPLAGHVVHKGVPGVEVSTGSLGHGLSIGAGMALSCRAVRPELGAREPGGAASTERFRVFVLLSDGECDEGSVWEAALFAAHQKLDNLVAVVDRNRLQGFGRVEDVLELEPFADKWRAFGWQVQTVDGHDHAALRAALRAVPAQHGKPTLLIANTIKGKGVSFMEDRLEWHYRSPNPEQLAQALAELAETGPRAEVPV